MSIFDEIAATRARQVAKGYDAAHDDEHVDLSIADAAACYASSKRLYQPAADYEFDRLWPWEDIAYPHPKLTHRERLIIAAALCVAEIERVDRLAVQS